MMSRVAVRHGNGADKADSELCRHATAQVSRRLRAVIWLPHSAVLGGPRMYPLSNSLTSAHRDKPARFTHARTTARGCCSDDT
jgi:hypothetical protein